MEKDDLRTLSLVHENVNAPLVERRVVSGPLIDDPEGNASGCVREIGQNTNIGPGSFTLHEHSHLGVGSGTSPPARPSNEGVPLLTSVCIVWLVKILRNETGRLTVVSSFVIEGPHTARRY